MAENQSIKLLRECDAGIKMGIISIDNVLGYVKNEELRGKLLSYKREYIRLRDDIQALLDEFEDNGKNINPIVQSMSWLRTNIKLTFNNSDSNVADIMTDGCNMGIKILNKFMNEYLDADPRARDIGERLVALGERQVSEMRKFL